MNLTGYAAGNTELARPVAPNWLERLTRLSARKNVAVLAGLAERTPEGNTHATHVVVLPDSPPQYYRKIHLSPFESPYYTAGNSVNVFQFKGIRFGIQLCYDAHFPDLSTAMALKQADIIFFPHASPRGSAEEKFNSWMRHLPARAFDNGLFVAAVNQTGDNGTGLSFPGLALALGPDGHLISKTEDGGEIIHMVDMDMAAVSRVRSHKMRYFLPNRRAGLVD